MPKANLWGDPQFFVDLVGSIAGKQEAFNLRKRQAEVFKSLAFQKKKLPPINPLSTKWTESWLTRKGELEQALRTAFMWQQEAKSWEDRLLEHEGHPRLRLYESAQNRQFAFRCTCQAPAIYQKLVSLRDLQTAPRARELIQKLQQTARHYDPTLFGQRPPKAERKLERQAERRAKAILHQMLTREQRWQLRGSNSFLVRAQDGRTYEVTEGRGVRLILDGEPHISYCIHPKEKIPVHDVMLAQKLLLETNLEYFFANSNATRLQASRTAEVQQILQEVQQAHAA